MVARHHCHSFCDCYEIHSMNPRMADLKGRLRRRSFDFKPENKPNLNARQVIGRIYQILNDSRPVTSANIKPGNSEHYFNFVARRP